MKYTEGYLAFLDILGFSKFVEDESNGQRTTDLFEFINKFSYLFNTSPDLQVQVSFFSDTIIITSENLENLVAPICIAESYLKDCLGLLFRGGIVYGKYYHKDGSTFGPAVVDGYRLEKKAVYSRIILADSIVVDENEVFYFRDIDGCICFNPYGMIFSEIVSYGPNGNVYPDDIDKELIEVFIKRRSELLSQINRYRGSSVVEKYLWRIRAFNYVCNYVFNMPIGEVIYDAINYKLNEVLKREITQLFITEKELFVANPIDEVMI